MFNCFRTSSIVKLKAPIFDMSSEIEERRWTLAPLFGKSSMQKVMTFTKSAHLKYNQEALFLDD